MTPNDYDALSSSWQRAQADAAQDAAYEAECTDDDYPFALWILSPLWLRDGDIFDDDDELEDARWEDDL